MNDPQTLRRELERAIQLQQALNLLSLRPDLSPEQAMTAAADQLRQLTDWLSSQEPKGRAVRRSWIDRP